MMIIKAMLKDAS